VTDFRRLLEVLVTERVEFVIVGGVALIAHGFTRLTEDLDVCYERSSDNLDRLARALAPLHPTLRGAPRGLPFALDARTLKAGLNFTLESDAGDIDLLGELAGVGMYQQVVIDAVALEIYGHQVRIISLEKLELAKRAAGRAKDLADLEAIREIKRRR
jgi:predicted nucleotidyltransferase